MAAHDDARKCELSRRAFCRLAGGSLVVAATAGLSGCGRRLRWSESQGRSISEEAARTTGGAPSPTSTTTTVAGSAPSTETTVTTTPPAADLAVVRGDYSDALVRRAVEELGGMSRFVREEGQVVIKPNVIVGRAPEYAATTNPLIVSALITMCFEAGAARVTVLDYPTASPRPAFRDSGIAQAVADAGGNLKYLSDRSFERVDIPQGELLTSWPLVSDALEADTFINVPIAKQHGLAGLTMAMKNLMGIMGDPRGRIHVDFPKKIVDICTLVKPHLVILDAYRILVRNGPTGGNLDDVQMPKTVVAGTNQVAVDAYGTGLFGLTPGDLPYLVEAKRRGLGETDMTKLRVVEIEP